MAVLDRDRDCIVIRVVYDGPPEAGKTTSLQALAGSLGQKLETPAEQYGRTLYFDWLDYTAGRFEGHPIRCQIVSVPGQAELAARRWRIMKDADVVVFVGDSTERRVDESLESLRLLSRFLERADPPRPAILFQANKRDLPTAMPMMALRKRVHEAGPSIGVVESVASDGTGIREAFVLAVRLSLDRVREQLQSNALRHAAPEVDSSAELLENLRGMETESGAAQASPLIRQVLSDQEGEPRSATPWNDVSVAVEEEARPRSPDPAAPSGLIWPPVDGRLILQEALPTRMTTHRLRGGSWAAGLGLGFRIFSRADCVYSDVDTGRAALLQVARLHVACRSLLSVNRCIVLAATGHGTWRLWQIVRAENALRDDLTELEHASTEVAATRIIAAAALLCDAGSQLQSAPCDLPCTLDSVGHGEHGPVYVGLMPMEARATASLDATTSIVSQLGSIIRNVLRQRQGDVLATIARIKEQQARVGKSHPKLDQVLMQLLAG